MNQITDPPLEYPAGTEFDYSVWQADSELTFVNVPWDNSYQDVWETDQTTLNAWIDGEVDTLGLKIGAVSYVTPGVPIRVNKPINAISKYNYIRVLNKAQPVPGEDQPMYLYYFILDTVRGNPNLSYIHVQIDVWQTYRRKVRFRRGFLERGHLGIANDLQDQERGRRWLTTPEGIDMGSEYMVVNFNTPFNINDYDILITASTDLTRPPGTGDDPSLDTATGGRIQGIASATSTFVLSRENLDTYMAIMASYPWVTQGIIRAAIVPKLTELGIGTTPVERENNYPPGPDNSSFSYLSKITQNTYQKTYNFDLDLFLDAISSRVGNRYAHLKKFMTAPYCMLELHTFQGDTMTYRPEEFQSGNVVCRTDFALIPGAERIEFIPGGYNGDEGYTVALSLTNFPTLPVVNNMAISALASTAHGRNAQRQGLAFGRDLAMAGSQNAYDSSRLGAATAYANDQDSRALSNELQGMQQGNARTEAMHDFATNTIMGAGAGGAAAGPAGAAVGALGGAATSLINAQKLMRTQQAERNQLAATNRTGKGISSRNYDTSQSINESNKALADYAAKGNYEQSILAMQASVQDTMLTQPGVSGGFGSEFLRLLQMGFRFEMRLKMIDSNAIRRIGEHWLRYGYMMNTFTRMPSTLHVMNKFSYWKLQELYLDKSPVPEVFKQAIRGIMTKGVTVWRDVNEIGLVDPATNRPEEGFRIRD